MAKAGGAATIREAVGVFDDGDRLQAAIDELSSAGFDRAGLGLLASERAVDRKLRVRTRDAAHEARALEILDRHGARDVHVHDLAGADLSRARPDAGDLEKALLDPTAVFAAPEEVLGRDDLTTEQKIRVLRRWAYDARELEVADDEGMPTGAESDLLARVLDALRALGART